MPIAWKSLMGAIVFSFVLVWNEFLIALMLTTSDACRRFGDDSARPRRPLGHSQRFDYSLIAAAAPVPRGAEQLLELRSEEGKQRKRVLSLRDIDLPTALGPDDVRIKLHTSGRLRQRRPLLHPRGHRFL